jgi:hypothetical protein
MKSQKKNIFTNLSPKFKQIHHNHILLQKYGDSSYMLYNDFGNISSSKQLPSFGKGKHKYI